MNMKDLIFSKKIHKFYWIRIFSDDSIEKVIIPHSYLQI